MKEFYFESNPSVMIEGKKYTLTIDAKTTDAVSDFSEKIGKLAVSGTEEDLNKAMELCESTVNMILGSGATDKIFAKRKKTAADFTKLFIFLTDAIKAAS